MGSQQFPRSLSVLMGRMGRGPLPRSNVTLNPQIHHCIVLWTPPSSFESLAPTLVHCHQPALHQSRGAWQKGTKGAGNFIAEHTPPGIPEKAGVGIKSEWNGRYIEALSHRTKILPWWKELWTPDTDGKNMIAQRGQQRPWPHKITMIIAQWFVRFHSGKRPCWTARHRLFARPLFLNLLAEV